MTGVLPEPGLSGDRLKVLKEALPSIKRVAALWNSDNPVHTIYLKAMPDAEPVGVQGPQDLDRALSVLSKNLPEALIVCPDPAFASQRTKIMSFALERKLPAIYSFSRYVEEGGLMSYGPNYTDMFRQAVVLVNSIRATQPTSPYGTGKRSRVSRQPQYGSQDRRYHPGLGARTGDCD